MMMARMFSECLTWKVSGNFVSKLSVIRNLHLQFQAVCLLEYLASKSSSNNLSREIFGDGLTVKNN